MSPLQSEPEPPEDVPTTIDVSIVLPCLNEEASVGACVAQAYSACAEAGLQVEVIVVDNGSTDGSIAAAAEASARVVEETTRGYGAALAAGIGAARGAIVVMADADMTYPLDRLCELIKPLQDGGADIVLGARLEQASKESMPILHRLVGTPVLTFLVRNGGGVAGISDSQSGFRAFRRETVLNLGLRSTGMEFASEMLIRASQASLRVVELPLGYRPRIGNSKLRAWRDGWRHLRLIVALSPHIVLWYPGLALIAVSLVGFGFSFAAATTPGGSAAWQPIFFSPTMLVLGVSALLTAAVMAHHLPWSAPQVRKRFSWVRGAPFRRRTRFGGTLAFLVGAGIDAYLFAAALAHTHIPVYERIAWAGLSQALMLSGALLVLFGALYPLIVDARGRPERPGEKR